MNQRIVAFGLCLVAAFPTMARSATAKTYSPSSARAYILQSEREWTATNPGEVAVVRRIVADDFVWVDDGKLLGKAGALRDAAAGPGDLAVERIDSLELRFFGGTAIVHGTNTSIHKNGRETHAVFVDTWVLRDGRWQVVASADVTIPRPHLSERPGVAGLSRTDRFSQSAA